MMVTNKNGRTPSALLAVLVAIATAGPAASAVRVDGTLLPTAHAPKAKGRARLVLKSASDARLAIATQKLAPHAQFDVVAGGVKVGSIATNAGGRGKLRLSTRPRGHGALLGFEPRGATLVVRDAQGDDVLEGDVPDDSIDPGDVACCLPHHDETECEGRTADACAGSGGTVASAATCLPDPCGGVPPGGEPDVACCTADSGEGAFVDDDPEVDCERRSAAECAAHGGTAVQAGSCEPNPCAPVPPASVVVCCVAEEGESECELRTPEHCAAHGGTVSTATSCNPDPCGGSGSGDDGGHNGSSDDGGHND